MASLSSDSLRGLDISRLFKTPDIFALSNVAKATCEVLMGACSHWGFSNHFRRYVVLTDSADGVKFSNGVRYIHIEGFNMTDFTEPSSYGNLVTSPARTIVDCIRYFSRGIEEEQLLIAIDDYFDVGNTIEELYKVGDFFNVDRNVIDRWVNESLEYVPCIDGDSN